MSNYIVREGQSLIDCCINALGRVDDIVKVAAANNIGITDALVIGTALLIPDELERDKRVLNNLADYKAIVAVANNAVITTDLYVDADYWEEDYT